MNNLRVARLSKQIQKDLADILGQIARDNYRGKMISISEVRLTTDLSLAKIYLSIFPNEKADEMVKEIELLNKQIRFELGNRIKNQVRKIPELKFYLDTTLDELDKIDKLLKNE